VACPRRDRNRNARPARLRELVPFSKAIVGIDLADDTQAAVITDHDSRVIARRRVTARAWELGEVLDWAVAPALGAGFASVTVACEPTGHRWRVLDQLAAGRGLALVCVQPLPRRVVQSRRLACPDDRARGFGDVQRYAGHLPVLPGTSVQQRRRIVMVRLRVHINTWTQRPRNSGMDEHRRDGRGWRRSRHHRQRPGRHQPDGFRGPGRRPVMHTRGRLPGGRVSRARPPLLVPDSPHR
jgi:hypothetical protein